MKGHLTLFEGSERGNGPVACLRRLECEGARGLPGSDGVSVSSGRCAAVDFRRHATGPAWSLGGCSAECVGLHLEGVVLLLEKMCGNSYTFGEKIGKCIGIPTHLEKTVGEIYTFVENV